MTSPITASVSIVVPMLAAVLLNFCVEYLTPPSTALSPKTSRMLPMIEPVIEALTTS